MLEEPARLGLAQPREGPPDVAPPFRELGETELYLGDLGGDPELPGPGERLLESSAFPEASDKRF